MTSVDLKWDTANSRYTDPVIAATSTTYRVYFPYTYKLVRNTGETDTILPGSVEFMIREQDGTPIRAFSATNLTASLTQKTGLATATVGLVVGRLYQLIMWYFDGAGNARSNFVSMTVTTGGKVGGSERSTPGIPDPLIGTNIITTLNRVGDGTKVEPGNNVVYTNEQLDFFIIAAQANHTYTLKRNGVPVGDFVTSQGGSGDIIFTPDIVGNWTYQAYDGNIPVGSGWTAFVKAGTTPPGGGGGISGLFSNPIVVAVLGGLALLVVSKNKRIRRTLHI